MDFFLRGLLIGFSIAAPVGPVGVLCIRRTLAEGRWAGFVSGLGAATADALYGMVAAFGLTAIASLLVSQQGWLRLVGGAFLLYLGVRTFLARPAGNTASSQPTAGVATLETGGATESTKSRLASPLLGAYASTFLLTLTNPLTILSFAAVFAGLGLASAPGDYLSAALLVAGVFTGSALWWFTLSGLTSLLRRRVTSNSLRWVNRISGVIIFAFGLAALASLFFRK